MYVCDVVMPMVDLFPKKLAFYKMHLGVCLLLCGTILNGKPLFMPTLMSTVHSTDVYNMSFEMMHLIHRDPLDVRT